MGTVADKLSKLVSTKADIKAAITEKGQTVAETDTFASYANKVRAIQVGYAIAVPVIVNTDPGVTLTAAKGDTRVTGTVNSSGVGSLLLTETGSWDIVATLGTNSKSITFNIPNNIQVTMPTLLVPDTYEVLESIDLGYRTNTDYVGLLLEITDSKVKGNNIIIDWKNNSNDKGLAVYLRANDYKGVYGIAEVDSFSIGTFPSYSFVVGASISYNTTTRNILQISATSSTVNFSSGNVSNKVTGTSTGVWRTLYFAVSPGYSGPPALLTDFSLYSVKIVNPSSNMFTYNWVPVKRKSDGVLGLYDTINNAFTNVKAP